MLASYRAPWVRYHNVVGALSEEDWAGYLSQGGDGVVELASAQMDDVVSQIEVPAQHAELHGHPRTILEVKRILLEHLHEIHAGGGLYPVRTAAVDTAPPGQRRAPIPPETWPWPAMPAMPAATLPEPSAN